MKTELSQSWFISKALLEMNVYVICGLSLLIGLSESDKQDACVGEKFNGHCPSNQVILIDTAHYGRMSLGRCAKNDLGHIGCQNDVQFLADRWCSGQPVCTVTVPNDDLITNNENCMEDLALYLQIQYHCVPVLPDGTCHVFAGTDQNTLSGYISPSLSGRCGTHNVPWVIEARSGQNIEVWLLDFTASNHEIHTLQSVCIQALGYITEPNLGVNVTICGAQESRSLIYRSKTNKIGIQLFRGSQEDRQTFLMEYKVVGCPEVIPPAHAWYRREGNEAVIGCDSDDREWRLLCNGASWEGHVGNCTPRAVVSKENPNEESTMLPFSTIILLTGVVCAAILLIIIVMVAGTIYIKKQSINHDMKLRSEYGVATLAHHPSYTLNKNPGYDTNTMKSNMPQNPNCEDSHPLVHVLDRTLSAPATTGTIPAGTIRLGCECNTLPRGMNTNMRGDNMDLLQ